MRKCLILGLLLLAATSVASGQNYTTVTATVTDPNGVAYSLGSYNVSLSNTTGQQPLLGGSPNFQKVYPGASLDTNGVMSIVLPSTAAMTPSGLQWNFSICANPLQVGAVFPPVALPCFTYTSTGTQISGASVDISASLKAAAATIAKVVSSTATNTITGSNTVSKLNGVFYVEGATYAKTDVGVNAAITAASTSGKVVLTPGTYALANTITIPYGVELHFDGNPTLNFSLTGSAPAFIITSTGSPGPSTLNQNALSGQAIVNMQSTGGTVFKICGGVNFSVGPVDGVIAVSNHTGNVMDVGPCTSSQSIDNLTVRGIDAETQTPGDFVQLLGNNGTSIVAPYILNTRFERLRQYNNGAAIAIAGYAVRVNGNATGPNVNFNGIVFANCGFALTSTNNKAAVHFQSTFSSAANSINMKFDGGYIVLPTGGSQPVFDDDGTANTAGSIWGVILDATSIQGGPSPTQPFSAHLLTGALSTGSLEYVGLSGKQFLRPISIGNNVNNTLASTGTSLNFPKDGTACWHDSAAGSDHCIVHNTANNNLDLSGFPASIITAYLDAARCESSASPAVCGANSEGFVALAAGGATLTVNTTAVTNISGVFITEDSSIGTGGSGRLAVTCNTTTGRVYSVTARTAGTSFVITSSANPVTNPACLHFWFKN